MMTKIVETNEGRFYAYKDNANKDRTAVMYFRKLKDPANSKWTFIKCEIATLQSPNSLDDLRFLKEIYVEVDKRLIKLNKENA